MDIVSLAAFVLPERLVAGRLPEGTDLAALERWGTALRGVLTDVRRDRPDEGTVEETRALGRMAEVGLDGLRVLGPGWVVAFRDGVNSALQELVRKELSAAETERKFALRQNRAGSAHLRRSDRVGGCHLRVAARRRRARMAWGRGLACSHRGFGALDGGSRRPALPARFSRSRSMPSMPRSTS